MSESELDIAAQLAKGEPLKPETLQAAGATIRLLREQLAEVPTLRMGYAGCIGLLCELSTQLRHNGENEDNRDNIEQAVSDWCALTGWTYRRILHRIEVLPPDPPPLTAEL